MEFSLASAAARAYGSARTAMQPDTPARAEAEAGKAAQGFADALNATEQTAKSAVTGGADPHTLVTALAETEMAVETAVTVRDKVVEAYQQILRMPV